MKLIKMNILRIFQFYYKSITDFIFNQSYNIIDRKNKDSP